MRQSYKNSGRLTNPPELLFSGLYRFFLEECLHRCNSGILIRAPSTLTVTVSPCFTPSAITAITLVASTSFSPFLMVILLVKFFAPLPEDLPVLREFQVRLLRCNRMFSCFPFPFFFFNYVAFIYSIPTTRSRTGSTIAGDTDNSSIPIATNCSVNVVSAPSSPQIPAQIPPYAHCR